MTVCNQDQDGTQFHPAQLYSFSPVAEPCWHSKHASQVIICSHNTYNALYQINVSTVNQVCNFS